MTTLTKQVLPPSMLNSSELSAEYPEIQFENNIIYLSDPVDITIVCVEILYFITTIAPYGKTIYVGFDTEWPFNFKKGPDKLALIQYCIDENTCYVFHVYNFETLPKSFIKILSHPKVKLVGLNIICDIKKLGRDFNLDVTKILAKNILDVGRLACNLFNVKENWSLQKLVKFLFKKNLSKHKARFRRSNWKTAKLTENQKIYAATDAYVSLLCYHELMNTTTLSY